MLSRGEAIGSDPLTWRRAGPIGDEGGDRSDPLTWQRAEEPRGRSSRGLSYRGAIAVTASVVRMLRQALSVALGSDVASTDCEGGVVRPIRAESPSLADVPRAVSPTEEVSQ